MFSLDFLKHIEAAHIIVNCLESEPDNLKAISDLIVKWAFIRLWGSFNTLVNYDYFNNH